MENFTLEGYFTPQHKTCLVKLKADDIVNSFTNIWHRFSPDSQYKSNQCKWAKSVLYKH